MNVFPTPFDETFAVPEVRFDSEGYLDSRLLVVPESDQGSMRTALKYLYMTDGPTNLPPERFARIKGYLEPAELIVIRWLKTRTNGSLRARYGMNALIQARAKRYRCEHCGFPDVRTLHLDHVKGLEFKEFACLCANCHNIKSRKLDWGGTKRYGTGPSESGGVGDGNC